MFSLYNNKKTSDVIGPRLSTNAVWLKQHAFGSDHITRKRAIAKALHLEGRTTSRHTFWVFRVFWFENIVFGRLVYFRLATVRRHVAVEKPTAQLPVTYAVNLTFDPLTLNQRIGCHALKLCAKFERSR